MTLKRSFRGYTLPIDTHLALTLYNIWKASNFVTLPFSGAYLEQPKWVLDLFDLLGRIEEFWQLNRLRPTANNVPKFDEVIR